LGYSREEFVAKTIPEITAPGQETLWVEKIQELRDVGKVEGDGVLLHKDGSPVAIMISARLISGEGRGIIQSFMRDITERKAVEWALRTSEQRFRILSESLPQGVFESDEKGHILYCNRSALQMFGYDDADLLRGLNVVETVVPEEREMAGENFRRVMEGRAITRGNEYQGIRKDGTRFPVSIFTNPKIEDGRVKGALGVVVDLTELKKGEVSADDCRSNSSRPRTRVDRDVGRGIAHDFNNLLEGLLGSLSITRGRGRGSAVLTGKVGEMKAGKRGAGLTSNCWVSRAAASTTQTPRPS
jgi:PAS domain S-box-containing protein